MNPSDAMVGDVTPFTGSDMVMTHGTTIGSMSGDLSPLIGLIYIVVTVFYMYCQYKLSRKMNIEYSWMAFIPFLSAFNLTTIAGLSYWWVLGMFIPLWNIYAFIKVYHGISKNTGHGAWWTVGLIFLSFIMLPITAFTYQPGAQGVDGAST